MKYYQCISRNTTSPVIKLSLSEGRKLYHAHVMRTQSVKNNFSYFQISDKTKLGFNTFFMVYIPYENSTYFHPKSKFSRRKLGSPFLTDWVSAKCPPLDRRSSRSVPQPLPFSRPVRDLENRPTLRLWAIPLPSQVLLLLLPERSHAPHYNNACAKNKKGWKKNTSTNHLVRRFRKRREKSKGSFCLFERIRDTRLGSHTSTFV